MIWVTKLSVLRSHDQPWTVLIVVLSLHKRNLEVLRKRNGICCIHASFCKRQPKCSRKAILHRWSFVLYRRKFPRMWREFDELNRRSYLSYARNCSEKSRWANDSISIFGPGLMFAPGGYKLRKPLCKLKQTFGQMQTLKLILKIMNLCFCVKYDLEEGQRNAIAWLVTRRDSVIFNKSKFLRLFSVLRMPSTWPKF